MFGLVDADIPTYNINVAAIEERSRRAPGDHDRPYLGNPFDVASVRAIAIVTAVLIEDCCDALAHGGRQHVGTFGDIGT